MTRNIKAVFTIVVLLFVPALARGQAAVIAQSAARAQTQQEMSVKRGAAVFAASCTGYCHGANGTLGSGAPALAGRGFDGDYILKTVMYGVPGTAMVAWGQRIPKDDSAAVIDYVKSLNGIVSAGAPAPRPVLTPTAENGHDLFFDSGGELKQCSNCHQINGSGIAVTRPIANVPDGIPGLRRLVTPGVATATVEGRTFPTVVVAQVRDETKVYDLTTVPPVLLSLPPSAVKLSDKSSWQHSSVLGPYSEEDLGLILEFLRAMTPKP